jgi:predicted transcriptional regulator
VDLPLDESRTCRLDRASYTSLSRDVQGVHLPQFGDLEAAIMDEMWAAAEPVKVRHVRDALAPNRPLAYTTVQTVMDILHRKGWLRREKDGRVNVYAPTASREDYVAELMAEALVHTDDRPAAVLRLVEGMSRREVTELTRLLAAAKEKRSR